MNKFVAFMSTFGLVALYGASAFAQGADAPANHFSMYAMFAIGAGLAIGLAAIGGSPQLALGAPGMSALRNVPAHLENPA